MIQDFGNKAIDAGQGKLNEQIGKIKNEGLGNALKEVANQGIGFVKDQGNQMMNNFNKNPQQMIHEKPAPVAMMSKKEKRRAKWKKIGEGVKNFFKGMWSVVKGPLSTAANVLLPGSGLLVNGVDALINRKK